MGKIYVGQTALRIQLSTGIDLTDITVSIKYEKPDGTTGVWQASKLNDSGTIYYDINTVTDLDQSGDWTFWAFATLQNGKTAPGEPVTISVYEEGT